MKFRILEQAVSLYERAVNEEHVQYRESSKNPKAEYDNFCILNGLDKNMVELYQQVGFMYQTIIPLDIEVAKMNIMEKYTRLLSMYYLKKGDKEKSESLEFIADELEV